MLLSKEERIVLLKYRIEVERVKTLFGFYKSYATGEDRIRNLKGKIVKLGGDPEGKIFI
ncbi:hypothetical protein NSS71_08120 [Niallia sp. FSL W8-0951]|uniref:hypothetical protein n=1 Tax=Niallia sp. FSL W8-0951 TaxID=2954639 RepID=UPI0030F6B089